jgi:hypothetical protein
MGIFDSPGLKSVPDKSKQQTVSTYAQPYVTNLLDKTQALTNAPMPKYTGQLTAGYGDLQEQAWKGLSGLTIPDSLKNAGTNLSTISQAQANLKYDPATFTNTYNAPDAYQSGNFANQYQATTPYQASNIQSAYQSPANMYTPTNVSTGSFDEAAAKKYMNPYIQQALNPQLEALQRQQAINQQGDMAKLAQAGAFGGSRQAILQAQNNENLLRQQSGLIGQGYNQAFTQAGQQFTADQARDLQAQQANVQQAQFAAQQGMTDAQMKAQYGMTAAQANEASRQFGQSQAANAAQLQAQYGLSAQQANEASKQFGYGQKMTAAQLASAADQARQQSQSQANQFAATYGLQGLQAAAQSQTAAATAGAQANQYGLANLQALSKAGTEQQALDQQAVNAQYNEYLRQLKYPQEMVKLQSDALARLPLITENELTAQKSFVQGAVGSADTVLGLMDKMKKQGITPAAISKYINDLTKTNPKATGGIKLDDSGNLIYPTAPEGGTPYNEEDGALNPGWGYDENNNPVWVGANYTDPTIDPKSPFYRDMTDVTEDPDYWTGQDADQI